jgi:putative hemolysin
LQALVKEERRGAKTALAMKEKIEASLAVIQLGITLVGAVAAATGGAGAEESLAPMLRRWGIPSSFAQLLAIALVVAPLTMITIVIGELVPKVFALRNKEWVCLKLARPMAWFSYSVWPAVWLLENIVRLIMSWGERKWSPRGGPKPGEAALHELHGAAAEARMSRLIGRREEGIIVSASHLAATRLHQVMLPAEYIGMLFADQSLSDALVAAHQDMHTRFPVTEELGNPQRIIGYANFKDIVAALRLAPSEPTLRNLVRPLRNFSAEMSAADCLEQMMRERNHIALVRDAQQKVIGMITLEDIVEELVGEIHDEFDRLPAFISPLGQGWIAGGFVPLTQLRDVTGIDLQPLSEKPIYTLSDWIVEKLGRPPRGGEEVDTNGCRILVRKTRHTLVQEAYLSHREAQPSEAAPV